MKLSARKMKNYEERFGRQHSRLAERLVNKIYKPFTIDRKWLSVGAQKVVFAQPVLVALPYPARYHRQDG